MMYGARSTRPARERIASLSSPRRVARAGRMRRTCAIVTAVVLLPYLTGCYTYRQGVASTVPAGTEVSLTITDQGRVGLGERMGAGILRVNGKLVDEPDTAYVVRVESIDFINAGTTHWAGEEIRMPKDYVGSVSTREFSQSKTWITAGIVVAALALAIGTVAIVGSGTEGDDSKPPGGDGQTSRKSPRGAPANGSRGRAP